jgi:hypothetical protein
MQYHIYTLMVLVLCICPSNLIKCLYRQILTNVTMGKRLMGKCISVHTSFWANVLWAYVFMENVFMGKCRLGKRHRTLCCISPVVSQSLMTVRVHCCCWENRNKFYVFKLDEDCLYESRAAEQRAISFNRHQSLKHSNYAQKVTQP